ncbi:TIGR02186 family protein [Halocynthiibacter sp. C4]|uniref:TIGR02186 family protein n=1 Tax=Halocynthiibacter sp. C4 TaxID=2992758 RepID=UPI00237C18BB|nr:TIGR02186 family protein [Halocynthiibacter sp. C4]MDE0590367.1 TIGR02186 family protein [Halocynthiibacter sp. C4]
MRFLLLLPLLLLSTLAAKGEEVVAGLSQNRVAITANFDGSEILIFGAVKRVAPPPEGDPLDVIITVSGPMSPVMVRRKDKRVGIWVNTDAVEVDAAPSFYAVASTRPLDDILTNTEDLRHKVSIENVIRSVGAPATITDSENFTAALIRIREDKGLYQTLKNGVELSEDTLFRTSIALPANLTEGDYNARFLLVRGGSVVGEYVTELDVSKVGLERWLFNLAHEMPLVYGILSLFIAIVAGWGASAFFRRYLNS